MIQAARKVGLSVAISPLDLTHAEKTSAWMNIPEIRNNVGVRKPITLESTRSWIASAMQDRGIRAFAVTHNDEHVGNLVFDRIQDHSARLSIYIGSVAQQGSGVAQQAILLGLKLMFLTHGMTRIWLTVHEENLAAVHIYEKLGFKLESRTPGGFPLENRVVAELKFGLLRDQFVL